MLAVVYNSSLLDFSFEAEELHSSMLLGVQDDKAYGPYPWSLLYLMILLQS